MASANFSSDDPIFLDIVSATRHRNDATGEYAAAIALRSGSSNAYAAFASAVDGRPSSPAVTDAWVGAFEDLRDEAPQKLLPLFHVALEHRHLDDRQRVKAVNILAFHEFELAGPLLVREALTSDDQLVVEASLVAIAKLGVTPFVDQLRPVGSRRFASGLTPALALASNPKQATIDLALQTFAQSARDPRNVFAVLLANVVDGLVRDGQQVEAVQRLAEAMPALIERCSKNAFADFDWSKSAFRILDSANTPSGRGLPRFLLRRQLFGRPSHCDERPRRQQTPRIATTHH